MCDIATHQNGKCPIIYILEDGHAYTRPVRADFQADIEGTIAWMRAVADLNDKIASTGQKAFDTAFRRALRAGKPIAAGAGAGDTKRKDQAAPMAKKRAPRR